MFKKKPKFTPEILGGMTKLDDVLGTIGHVQSCPECKQKFAEIVEHSKASATGAK